MVIAITEKPQRTAKKILYWQTSNERNYCNRNKSRSKLQLTSLLPSIWIRFSRFLRSCCSTTWLKFTTSQYSLQHDAQTTHWKQVNTSRSQFVEGCRACHLCPSAWHPSRYPIGLQEHKKSTPELLQNVLRLVRVARSKVLVCWSTWILCKYYKNTTLLGYTMFRNSAKCTSLARYIITSILHIDDNLYTNFYMSVLIHKFA